MKDKKFKKLKGMVLIDNYWVDEKDVEKYLSDRKKAAEKATTAMESFCDSVELQWAGSQDGEAVVGFDSKEHIRSVIHLDPHGVKLILSMDHQKLIEYLNYNAD